MSQTYLKNSESCGLVVEYSAHDQKVVGLIQVQCWMEVVSKPCQVSRIHIIKVRVIVKLKEKVSKGKGRSHR